MSTEKAISGWDDSLLGQMLELLPLAEGWSIPFIQRKLKIGYNRADRLRRAARHACVKTALLDSWASAVQLYEKGVVNNECTLQAFLFGEVRSRLNAYTVICEPAMPGFGKQDKPDLVILQGSEVICVIEIKIKKHPVFEKDLEKMRRFLSVSAPFEINFDPVKTGRWGDLICSVCPYCLAAFMVVGRDDAQAVYEHDVFQKSGDALSKNFVLISHAAAKTSNG
ncbi:MAG: hypothetical protein U1D36_19425 [Hydrogenophaga sp.]|jgi:hypothetical protein|uniref:hypothetical protein n=1 Tax=Hydrogenophaga sp. TaxID=1904254 RepID=UPI002731F8A5|nr:hypothetical protein [Hydrogenophaga sp.]MDP2407302.1 hypothetical protein [Hydrogenophaga sp.]MDZ4176630.1 hypothetical protein [Hydrogenophaga sp.]